jgi:hypothetical protein
VLERRAGYTRAVLTRDLYRTRLHIARLQLSKAQDWAAVVPFVEGQINRLSPACCSRKAHINITLKVFIVL